MCLFGWTICLTILCANGGERHIQDVVALGPDVVARVQLLNWTSQVFGIFGVGAGKVSVSALLLGILRNTWRDWQVIYLWVVCITLEVCVSTACSILTFAQCRPAAALWDARIPGKCINPKIMADFGTFTGGMSLAKISFDQTNLTDFDQRGTPLLTPVWLLSLPRSSGGCR